MGLCVVTMEDCPLFPCVVLLAKYPMEMSTKDVPMLAQGIACQPLSWESCVGKASSAAGEMEEVPATEDLPVRRKRKASETISANPLLRYFKASLGSKHASTASVSSTGMLSSEQDESNREQERNFL